MNTPRLTHPSLTIQHGFFTREGGVSAGSYASLNCGLGSGDIIENVTENHRRICQTLDVEQNNFLFCKQIHSNKVITVNDAWARDDRPQADAMVTNKKELALAVMSADCSPVLLCDAKAGVIGAAHCGWKGALDGVLENTVTAMIALGATPRNIHAVIGPSIQQSSYEVGPEFPTAFLEQDKDNERFFISASRAGHFLFDLPAYAMHRMKLRGLTHIHSQAIDTLSDEQRFFSYRRTTLQNAPKNGVQMSALKL